VNREQRFITATRSPTFLISEKPTAKSDRSVRFCRPAPSITDARPINSASIFFTTPADLAGQAEHSARDVAPGFFSSAVASPILRVNQGNKFLPGASVLEAFFQCALGVSETFSARSTINLIRSGGPPPCKIVYALGDLERISYIAPERLIHRAEQGRSFYFHRFANARHRFGQLLGFLFRLHERAAAEFHIEDKPIEISASFLLMMLATMSGCDGTVPVTSRTRRVLLSAGRCPPFGRS